MTSTQRRSGTSDTGQPPASVDSAEVAKFSALADQWWDPKGPFAPLHQLNPVRLALIREAGLAHFDRGKAGLKPFANLTLLDIGCGGGLLCEPLARLGFSVTGADASERNVQCAGLHAEQSGLSIDYRATTAEALAESGGKFDVVLAMEIVEHVADVGSFLECCAALVAPGGLLFLATINRTLKSLALAKIGAEYVLGWIPRGTHDWNRFVTPAEIRAALEHQDFFVQKTQGVAFDPLGWNWRPSRDTGVNYMLVASRLNSPR